MPSPEALVSCLSDLTAEPIEPLWPGRLAVGKLALIDGDPGEGKSLVTLDLAARLTTGRLLPDGFQPAGATAVLLIGTAEDGVRDTVLPRLRAAGADLGRIHVFQGRAGANGRPHRPSFPEDCGLLEAVVRDRGVRLVIADPVMAFVSPRLCVSNDQMARQVFDPLAAAMAAARAALLMVRHLTKRWGMANALYRGSGGIGIIGAARSAFLVGRHPDDPDLRLLAAIKSNLGPLAPTLGYRVRGGEGGSAVIEWDGPVELTAAELVVPRGRGSYGETLPRAVDFLRELLGGGPVARDDAFCRARAADIADRTLQRAKTELKVVSRECIRPGRRLWFWCLPDQADDFGPDNWDDAAHRQAVLNQREMRRFLEVIHPATE